MSLSETIERLVLDGYAIIFEKHSKSSMTITLSNGCVLSRRGCYTSVMDNEDLSKILEYMKKDVDRRDAEYRAEKKGVLK